MKRATFAPIFILIGACGARDLAFDAVDSGADAADARANDDASDDADACAGDADCRLPELACDPSTHQCAGCMSSDQCEAPYGVCNLDLCVQCNDDADCHGGTCEPTTHRCVCNQRTGTCCTSDAFCESSRSGRVCDLALGQCVQCASDSDCAYSGEVCNRTTGRCVECLTAQNCGMGQACFVPYHVCLDTNQGGFAYEGGPGPGANLGADARVGP